MTQARRDPREETAFGRWVRTHPALDSVQEHLAVTDTDWWFHQYVPHRDRVGERFVDAVMLVELKTFGADVPFSQRDTLRLLNTAFRGYFLRPDGRVALKKVSLGPGQPVRHLQFYGMFCLQLQGDSPPSSTWMRWHGRLIDEPTLVDVLAFRRNPITLRTRETRRHHTAPAHRQLSLVGGAP